jgi:hypothetical protein
MSGIFRKVKVSPFSGGKKMESWEQIADSIVDTIKDRSKSFLDQNEEAKKFVTERAQRLAKLTIEYNLASDDAAKKAKKEQMEIVRDSIETELVTVALNGQEEAKSTFKNIVNSVFATVVKVLPTLLSAI